MPQRVTRRQFCLWSSLGVGASAGCLGGAADRNRDEQRDPEPLPESEYAGTDVHYDSAFSVYNDDESQYTADIQLVRQSTDETILDGRYVIPEKIGQRVTSLVSSATYRCRVSLDDETISTEYDASRGKELALRIRDGELKLFTSYLE